MKSKHQARPTPTRHAPPPNASLGARDDQLGPSRISLLQPGTWVDWLEDLGGVLGYERHVGTMGLSLRGGLGGQIAMRFDGVPLLSAQQALDPSRQLLTIDPRIIGRVNLVRGPSSYRWGDRSFAGSVGLHSATMPLATGKAPVRFSGILRGSYQSAAQAVDGHGTLGLSGQGGGLLLAGGGGINNGRKGGGTTGTAHQSDYQQANALGKLHWRWGRTRLKALYLYGQAEDIKYTTLFSPQSDVWRYHERRHLAYTELRQGVGKGHLRLLLGYQYLESYEHAQDIALGSRAQAANREDQRNRHMLSALVEGQHQLSRVTLQYQLEWTWETMQTTVIATSGLQRLLPTPLPDTGERHTLAASAGIEVRLLDGPIQLNANAGGRIHPHWDNLQPPNGFAAIQRMHLPWAARAGLTLGARHKLWALQLFYATGFRVPSWQEQAGAGHQGRTYWRTNDQLQPEYNHSVEAIWTVQYRQRLRWQVRSFVQLWQHMIGRSASTHEGRTSVNALPVEQHANEGQILPFVGIESMVWLRIWRGWSAKASLAWLHLFDAALVTTPQHIWPTAAPLHGRLSTRYQFGKWGGIEASLAIAAGQATRHTPLSLQLLLRQKSPSYAPWTTVQVRANLRITRHLHLVVNLENMSNQAYLRYGSLTYAPGINYRMQLVGRW